MAFQSIALRRYDLFNADLLGSEKGTEPLSVLELCSLVFRAAVNSKEPPLAGDACELMGSPVLESDA